MKSARQSRSGWKRYSRANCKPSSHRWIASSSSASLNGARPISYSKEGEALRLSPLLHEAR